MTTKMRWQEQKQRQEQKQQQIPFGDVNQRGQGKSNGGNCLWQFGNHIPGSANDFGQNAQYGTLLQSTYLAFGGGGASNTRYNNFRQIINNPC